MFPSRNPDVEPKITEWLTNTLTTKHQADIKKVREAERQRIYKAYEDYCNHDIVETIGNFLQIGQYADAVSYMKRILTTKHQEELEKAVREGEKEDYQARRALCLLT